MKGTDLHTAGIGPFFVKTSIGRAGQILPIRSICMAKDWAE